MLFRSLQELTRRLGANSIPRPGNRALTVEELRQMSQSPCITIGGHTITHNMLSAEPEDIQRHEIVGSKARLEEILEKPVTTFSYPFGAERDYTEKTVDIVKTAGYIKAATTSVGLVDERVSSMLIPRNGMPFYPRTQKISRHLRKLWYC